MGIVGNKYTIITGERRANKTAGKSTHRWEDNIETDEKLGVKMWIGFSWIRIGLNDMILRTS
jgi:hypothetical protein